MSDKKTLPATLRSVPETTLSARQGTFVAYLKELLEFRELLTFMIWKEIKVQFARTSLGLGWLLLRPILTVTVMTVVFGKIARIPTGKVPYLLFALSGIVAWSYFSSVANKSAASLVGGNAAMVTKVYFPRSYLLFSISLSGLIELVVCLLLFLMVSIFYYGWMPTASMVWLPVPLLLLVLTAQGAGFWLAALAVHFRDVRIATSYIIQLMMFTAPVIWPTEMVAKRLGDRGSHFLEWYGYYPLAGIIEGFRATLLGEQPMPWDYIAKGYAVAAVLIVTGLIYFRRREKELADVV